MVSDKYPGHETVEYNIHMVKLTVRFQPTKAPQIEFTALITDTGLCHTEKPVQRLSRVTKLCSILVHTNKLTLCLRWE